MVQKRRTAHPGSVVLWFLNSNDTPTRTRSRPPSSASTLHSQGMAKKKASGIQGKAAAKAVKKAKAAQKTERKEKKKTLQSRDNQDDDDDLEGILEKVCLRASTAFPLL